MEAASKRDDEGLDAEDTHLIPEFLGLCQRNARVLVQEHRHIRARLADLAREIGVHVVRRGELRNFNDELRAHAQTEDRLLYQWADEHLDRPSRNASIDALTRNPTA
jgi:hypothetical protein